MSFACCNRALACEEELEKDRYILALLYAIFNQSSSIKLFCRLFFFRLPRLADSPNSTSRGWQYEC